MNYPSSDAPLWVSENSPGKQYLLSCGLVLVALCLIYLSNQHVNDNRNTYAALLLGLLLMVIGVGGVVFAAKQTITIDPKSKLISIEDSNFWRSSKKLISFGNIARIDVGYMGRATSLVNYYYLILHLRNGSKYPLFAPGRFYEGSGEKFIVESWRERLTNLVD